MTSSGQGRRRLARVVDAIKRGHAWRLVATTRVPGIVLAAAATLSIGLPLATPLSAQAPDEAWRTLTTEHFRVTFPEELESLGRRAADRAERAWDELTDAFVDPPDDLIDVLVTDHTDVPNGFAGVFPSNRIVIYARPPVEQLSIGFADEWLELVITHELVHILHLDMSLNPIGRIARSVFGRVGAEWPFFPGLGTPRWVTEGIATWYESELTNAGRVHGTFFEMQLRTAALEGRFEDIGQASGNSPQWPRGNRPYAYGSYFFDYLVEKYGDDRMAAFAEAIASQWIPYRIDAAGRSAFGVSLTDEWKLWRAEWEAEVATLDERLAAYGPITEPERLTDDARNARHPKVSPDGRYLIYNRADGRSDIQIRVRDLTTGEDTSLGRTNGFASYGWLPGNRVVLSQVEAVGPYRAYSDLYIRDLDGNETRLTRGARIDHPSGSPDGSTIVAVRQGGGTNEVVLVDPSTGGAATLIEADPDVHWAFPRWSPDGRWIVATRWEMDAFHDVVLLDATTGAVVHEVTRDRAMDLAPEWSPDGSWIVWGSDRTGIPNIYGARVGPDGRAGAPRLLTNVRTGAAYPSIDPSSEWLYFAGHHVDGWEVERIPLALEEAAVAPPVAARFEQATPPPVRGEAPGDVEGYSPFPTLGPTYWEVLSADEVTVPGLVTDTDTLRARELLGVALGVQTGGRDLVGRHAWGANLLATTTGGRLLGGVAYSYAGLGNPILSVQATQDYRSGGQTLVGTAQDTILILRRERALEGAATFLIPSWRHSLSLTLGGGMIWESRELLDAALDPADGFSLSRPTARISDLSASINYNSSRAFAFQMGLSKGLSAFLLGRTQTELALPDSLVGVPGADRSLREATVQLRAGMPLWGGGFARHILALRFSAGVSSGPGANVLHFRAGGASGRREAVTGAEAFGGDFILFPVRGYAPSTRFGRYAWSGSAEYRFPLLLINRGFRAWPVHLDRAIGTLFFDAGNAWGPDVAPTGFVNPLQVALASVGAEVTLEVLALYDVRLRLRTGVGVPLVVGNGARAWLRVGLPF